jgi:hypothetical protein
MLEQVLHHQSVAASLPWHPAAMRPAVRYSTALWLPALTATFQDTRADASMPRHDMIPHLTQVLLVDTSMIQYLASSSQFLHF